MMGTWVITEIIRQGENVTASGQPGTQAGVTKEQHCWNNRNSRTAHLAGV